VAVGVLEPLLPALQLHPAEVVAATAVDLRLEAAVAVTKDHPAAAAAALHHHATLVVHLLVVSTKEEEEEEEEEVLEEATVDHLQHETTDGLSKMFGPKAEASAATEGEGAAAAAAAETG